MNMYQKFDGWFHKSLVNGGIIAKLSSVYLIGELLLCLAIKNKLPTD